MKMIEFCQKWLPVSFGDGRTDAVDASVGILVAAAAGSLGDLGDFRKFA